MSETYTDEHGVKIVETVIKAGTAPNGEHCELVAIRRGDNDHHHTRFEVRGSGKTQKIPVDKLDRVKGMIK